MKDSRLSRRDHLALGRHRRRCDWLIFACAGGLITFAELMRELRPAREFFRNVKCWFPPKRTIRTVIEILQAHGDARRVDSPTGRLQ
jgi:hypothetical protein